MVVNSKKIRRLLREHDLQPKRRRRFAATTNSDHDCRIFPDLVHNRIVDGPNQLWVAPLRRASSTWRQSLMLGHAA
jgi:putative transposase